MPTKHFSSIYSHDDTPMLILPEDIRVETIITIIEWVRTLQTSILLGYPMKRTKLKSLILAKSTLDFSAKAEQLPKELRPTSSWCPYSFNLT